MGNKDGGDNDYDPTPHYKYPVGTDKLFHENCRGAAKLEVVLAINHGHRVGRKQSKDNDKYNASDNDEEEITEYISSLKVFINEIVSAMV